MKPGQWLKVHCLGCRHTGFVTLDTLRTKCQPYERLTNIEHGFRCSRCATRGQVQWQVEEYA